MWIVGQGDKCLNAIVKPQYVKYILCVFEIIIKRYEVYKIRNILAVFDFLQCQLIEKSRRKRAN